MVTFTTQASPCVFRPWASKTKFLTGSSGKLNREVCFKLVASTSPNSFKVEAKKDEWLPGMPSPVYLNGSFSRKCSSTLHFRTVFPFVSISPVLRHQRYSLPLRSKADKSVESKVLIPSHKIFGIFNMTYYLSVAVLMYFSLTRWPSFKTLFFVTEIVLIFTALVMVRNAFSGSRDTIKAGSVEGQVVEMDVPNSHFSNQSRAVVIKITFQIEDLLKSSQISNDVRSMLRLNSKVLLGNEAPYCILSRRESSNLELTIRCSLRDMSEDEIYSKQQDILLQSVKIIKSHGGTIGKTVSSGTVSE